MNRLESQYFDLYTQVDAASLNDVCLEVVTAVRAAGIEVEVDWAAVETAVVAGGDEQVSASLHATAEAIDDRAFGYADTGDPRYEVTFSAARLASSAAYACAMPSVDSVSDALYEYVSASGDDSAALDLVARVVRR